MSDEADENPTEKLCREKSLPLRAEGGRVFVHSADPSNLARCTIELKCWWSPDLLTMFDSPIRIGDEVHKPFKWDEDGAQVFDEEAENLSGWTLRDCPIMLSLYSVDEGWLAESATKNGGQPILGRLHYYPPAKTADGVVNQERPTITAWVALGRTNFELVRDRLMATETPEFDLGITIEFPRGTVETGPTGSKVHWDGKGDLPVSAVTIVWKRGDWDSDSVRWRHPYRQPEPEPEPYEPPREHVELMQRLNRLEAAVLRLATPVWLASAAAVVAVILSR